MLLTVLKQLPLCCETEIVLKILFYFLSYKIIPFLQLQLLFIEKTHEEFLK